MSERGSMSEAPCLGICLVFQRKEKEDSAKTPVTHVNLESTR